MDQGRKGKVHAPGTVASQGFDGDALAHVHRLVEAAPRYADGRPVLDLSVAADGADPNVAAPAAGAFLAGANRDAVSFVGRNTAGHTLDIEVWTRSDLDPAGLGTPLWLRVAVVTGIVAHHEYLLSSRARDVYLRPVNVALGGAAAVPLYACLV